MMMITGKDHLAPLTGLRGFAAYAVLVAHAVDQAYNYGGTSLFAFFASRLAFFGMSLFFVLSGFVIYFNYANDFVGKGVRSTAWGFFVARFARLYPLYFVAIVASLPSWPAPAFEKYDGALLAHLSMTQSWVNYVVAVFQPAWSISTEWFFYFAFVPLVFLVHPIRRPVPVLAVFCAVVFVGLIFVLGRYEAPLTAFVERWNYTDTTVSTGAWSWVIYMGPLVRLFEFIAGMLAAKVYLTLRHQPPQRLWMSLVLFVAALWCLAVVSSGRLVPETPLYQIRSNFIYAPALAAFMACICLSSGWWSRWLSSRPLQYMGAISYSVYIWSFFVNGMLSTTYRSPQLTETAFSASTFRVLLVVGFTTMIADGSYRLIEMPARRWLRRLLNPSSVGVEAARSS